MNPLAPAIAAPLERMQVGRLRRQLQGELNEIRERIENSGLHDEMTGQISQWQERFSATFQGNADERWVSENFTRLLQELLIDPVTGAPLDGYSVLGNDGHTYGRLSLAVYQLSVPEQFRERSPLDPENHTRFETQPHPVVRHMIGWLERHNALLYSEELEQQYIALLPQQRQPDLDARMDRIRARQAALEQRQLERAHVQNRAIDQHIDGRLHAWEQEVEGRFRQLGIRPEPPRENLHIQQIAQAVNEDDQALARLRAQLDEMEHQLRPVEERRALIAQEEQAALERLRARIQRQVGDALQPIAQRIEGFANDAFGRIQALGERDQADMARFEEVIQRARAEAQALRQENHNLELQIHDIGNQVDQARQDERMIQQAINETRIAINEMKDRSCMQVISIVAIVGGFMFGTWAIHSALTSAGAGAGAAGATAGSSFGLSTFPVHSGAGLKASLWLF